MTETRDLFAPATLGDISLANRIVMAPMTRNRAPGTLPTALMAEYYAQRASAGLIVGGGTAPAASGRGYIDIPGLYSAEQVEGWRLVADRVHDAGGKIVAQLMHVGRISHPDFQEGTQPVAPSAIAAKGDIFTHGGMKPMAVPRALTEAEIESLVTAYADAARNAVKAGLDGVEIHAANGYLPNQFLAPNANQRNDRWGGSAENRARFLVAITEATAAAIGAGRVGVRISPGNPFNDIADPAAEETYEHVTKALGGRGLAYLHILDARPAFDIAAMARRNFGGPLILNGGYDRARAEADIASGRTDFVAFGSGFIANPDLPERLLKNAPLNKPDTATFYGGTEKGYTDYATLAA